MYCAEKLILDIVNKGQRGKGVLVSKKEILE